MLKLFVLTLWSLTLITALFVLVTNVWQGRPHSVLYFVGAALAGVIGPLGTWAITERDPETDWSAWMLLGIAAGIVAIFALLRLVALLGA
jgi:disulfide bond formation protein DsbB